MKPESLSQHSQEHAPYPYPEPARSSPNLISLFHCSGRTEGSVWFRGFLWYFVTWLNFYGEELLAPLPTPKLEDHPLSAVRDSLFNIFAATFHICRPFLHPQPEDAPCRGDRDPLITVTGTHLSLWQGPTCHWWGPTSHCDRDLLITWEGPTCHCDRDPLITVTGTH
jgi:hypothetical protein